MFYISCNKNVTHKLLWFQSQKWREHDVISCDLFISPEMDSLKSRIYYKDPRFLQKVFHFSKGSGFSVDQNASQSYIIPGIKL